MRLHKTLWILIIFMAFFTTKANLVDAATTTALLDVNKGRTLVPIRFVSEEFGAQVTWNGENQSILIQDQETTILLKIGDSKVTVNNDPKTLDAAPFLKDSTTYVPLRFVSTILGFETEWDAQTETVRIFVKDSVLSLKATKYNSVQPSPSTVGNSITQGSKTFKVGSKTIKANVVTVDLSNPSIDLKVGLAKDQVGKAESLAGIAKRHGAILAINGTFFDAYTTITEPYGMLISNGKIVHLGRERTVFSFDSSNNVSFDIFNPSIVGSTNGSDKWPNNWYAYWLNRTPKENAAANAIIFTPERGESVGFAYGTNIVVEGGKVKEIVANKNVKIPKTGYVINLMGSEAKSLLNRFSIGTTVNYTITDKNVDLSSIEGAVGAGPRLLTAGKTSINFELEGFTEAKIKTGSAARSAIGVTSTNKLIFVTTSATIKELAEIMKQAGAYHAMNLDGGASSGLYYNGKYITTPGRELSNAILVIKK